MTRFIGLDPGYDRCGYAIIDEDLNITTYGVIRTNKEQPYWDRVKIIFDAIGDVITGCRVQVAGTEKPFIGNNVRHGIEVAGVWGVIGLALRLNGIEYMELTTTQVKAAVANGRATKEDVRHGVETILDLKLKPGPDDITDALAAAICTRDRWNLAQSVADAEQAQ